MATLYQNTTLPRNESESQQSGYDGYVEPDTRIPPKARPVLNGVSVNAIEIPEADILAEAQQHPAENPGEALATAARALAVRELLIQEAKRLAVNADPETDEAGRLETSSDALVRTLIEQKVTVPQTSEAECRRFYENNPARFTSGATYEARHILLAAPETDAVARKTAKSDAVRIIAHLKKAPTDFGVAAARHSACSSKEQGGNLGQIVPGSTVSEFESALYSMSEGELRSEPVETRYGFHVVALDRKIPGNRLPFEMVHERISAWLEASSWARAVSQYVGMLAGKANVRGVDLGGSDGFLVQ